MKFASVVSLLSTVSTAWAGSHHQPAPKQAYEMPAHDMPAPIYDTQVVQETPTYQAVVTETAPSHIMTEIAYPAQTDIVEAAMTHTVSVGGAGLVYNPSEIAAAVGDVVRFIMLAKNHTVTQSTFAKPCVKLATGLDSGFLPNAANDTASAPTFELTVDTTEPTWWYCRQRQPKPHCGSGMVFAINPTAEKSFEIFRQAAIDQNGTDSTPPADSGAPVGGPVTLTVDNGGLPPATTTIPQLVSPPAYTAIAPGWNNQGNPSACNCACFCGAAAFPAGNGIGSFGGYGGSLPAPWG